MNTAPQLYSTAPAPDRIYYMETNVVEGWLLAITDTDVIFQPITPDGVGHALDAESIPLAADFDRAQAARTDWLTPGTVVTLLCDLYSLNLGDAQHPRWGAETYREVAILEGGDRAGTPDLI